MDLYTLETRFDPRTGKPAKPARAKTGWACDFCGARHGADEHDPGAVTYAVHESGDIEPDFDQLRVPGHPEISVYDVFNRHPTFRYCGSWDGAVNTFCETKMLVAAVRDKKNPFTRLNLAMYEARVAALARVLAAGTCTLEDFDL